MTTQSDKLTQATATVIASSKALLNKDVELLQDPDFRSMMALAHAHGFMYKGPQLNEEIQSLGVALDSLDKAEKEEDKAKKEELKTAKPPEVVA